MTQDVHSIVSDELQLGQYIPLHYHYNMLQDEVRTTAFRDAIRTHAKPGMKVLELGGGTGILSWFAACCGADVICVERNPALARSARKFLADNPATGSVQIVEADASDYLPPHPVDLVICEMLHVGLLREKQLDVIDAFKRRYQRSHGAKLPMFIPDATILMAQPIEQDFNFLGYVAAVPIFQQTGMAHEDTRELGPLNAYAEVHYQQAFDSTFDCEVSLTITANGQLNALRFGTQSLLAVTESEPFYISWANQLLVLPLSSPLQVKAGDNVVARFHYHAGGALEQLSESLTVSAG